MTRNYGCPLVYRYMIQRYARKIRGRVLGKMTLSPHTCVGELPLTVVLQQHPTIDLLLNILSLALYKTFLRPVRTGTVI